MVPQKVSRKVGIASKKEHERRLREAYELQRQKRAGEKDDGTLLPPHVAKVTSPPPAAAQVASREAPPAVTPGTPPLDAAFNNTGTHGFHRAASKEAVGSAQAGYFHNAMTGKRYFPHVELRHQLANLGGGQASSKPSGEGANASGEIVGAGFADPNQLDKRHPGIRYSDLASNLSSGAMVPDAGSALDKHGVRGSSGKAKPLQINRKVLARMVSPRRLAKHGLLVSV